MVKRCAYGLCNSDDRYKDRVQGVFFIPFPKPKTNRECLRWIKLCNRPHSQLNVNTITKNTYVCSKHFHKGGPTAAYPDPLPCDRGTSLTPVRRPPQKRRRLIPPVESLGEGPYQEVHGAVTDNTEEGYGQDNGETTINLNNTQTQTDSQWIDPMDMLMLATESRVHQMEKQQLIENVTLMSGAYNKLYEKTHLEKTEKTCQTDHVTKWTAKDMLLDKTQFKYYTAFEPEQFLSIYKFLVPSEEQIPIKFPNNRKKEVMKLSLMDHLFLTVCKCRHNFHYSDLGYRFAISKQTVGVIFNHWINFMFLRFGEVSIWPPRDVIAEHMPEKYKLEFPSTFAILDCTEIKISKPSSLKAESQTYSEYKSGNTLKGLVACDPRGSVIFASMLFSGSISDKETFTKSGLKQLLLDLIQEGYLHKGDGLMVDKGFNIEKEIQQCGLLLNIPPLARQGQQMNKGDALLTKKIASHRVHVERAIERIKRFKILSGRLPLTLYTNVNQIWYVCSFLTNFFPPCIQDN